MDYFELAKDLMISSATKKDDKLALVLLALNELDASLAESRSQVAKLKDIITVISDEIQNA